MDSNDQQSDNDSGLNLGDMRDRAKDKLEDTKDSLTNNDKTEQNE